MHYLFILLLLLGFTATVNSKILPLETALDADGKPLFVSANPASAMDIPAQKSGSKKSKLLANNTSKSPSSFIRKSDPKIAKRRYVANDPSCRWLDKRLDELEASIGQKFSHQPAELAIRLKEWDCMKCGGQGPSMGDHDRCQYRR